MSAPNTLGLDDDLDSVELVIAIERAFDITIADEEAVTVTTMGELHDIVAAKLAGAGGEKCQTSMSFYRVRRALRAVVGDVDLRPNTQLASIWEGSPRLLSKRLQNECELRVAPFAQTNMSGFGALFIVAVIFGAPILLIAKVNGWWILALSAAFVIGGWALIRLDPYAFGKEIQTVGDLARKTALQNYGMLARDGGRCDPESIWDALVEIGGRFSERLPAEQIERDTVILQSQFDKPREPA